MRNFAWTIRKSSYIIKDRWLTVRADSCEMPSGQTIEPFYVLEYPTWVNVVALTADDDVILVRQYRHGLQETILGLPSGVRNKFDLAFSTGLIPPIPIRPLTGWNPFRWLEVIPCVVRHR